MDKQSKIYIAGHRGLVGSAILRKLKSLGYSNLIFKSRDELDLQDKKGVEGFFELNRPEYVFLAAAKVGGIKANDDFSAEFLYDNLQIQLNVIHCAHLYKVKKLMFLGSSCVYPKYAEIPINENSLLTGKLEETNESYAIAKIAGIKMCESYRKQYGSNFISIMPTNIYGPNDNFDLDTSHVFPALIRKVLEAKDEGLSAIDLWGTGEPKREFLHVDDLANACVFLMDNYNKPSLINVGTGKDISIKDLLSLIMEIAGYRGEIKHDLSKPDGTPRKVMDVSKLFDLGWKPEISLRDGIKHTIDWYLENRISQ